MRRIGLPASAWDLRLLGRPLGTAVAARNPNLVHTLSGTRVRTCAGSFGVARSGSSSSSCLVAMAVVFVPVVGIVMGLVVAALCRPWRSGLTCPSVRIRRSPSGPSIRRPRSSARGTTGSGPRSTARCSPVRTARVPVVFVTDLELGARALADHRDELATVALPYDQLIPGHFIRFMAPQDHQRYRRLLAAAFQPSTVAAPGADARRRESIVAGIALGRFATCRAPGVEPEPALRPLVLRTWYRVMFGFSPDDDEWRTIERCHDVVDSRHTVSGTAGRPGRDRRAGGSSSSGISVTSSPVRRRSPCCASEISAAADDSTLVRNLIVLAWTSSADTTGLLVWLLKRLTDDPVWLERLREALGHAGGDRPRRPDRRRDPPPRSERGAGPSGRRPVMIGEHEVPPGWHLRIGLREAHRDADVFDDPDRFDPDRFARSRYGRLEYAPFGLDHHQCVGEALVRTTARQFVLALADGYRCTGRDDGPDQVSSWRHWHPNPEWRLVIDPIGRRRGHRGSGVDPMRSRLPRSCCATAASCALSRSRLTASAGAPVERNRVITVSARSRSVHAEAASTSRRRSTTSVRVDVHTRPPSSS